MSTTSIQLLQFKIQSHLQKTGTLNAGTLFEEKLSKICNITFATFPLSHQNNYIAILNT